MAIMACMADDWLQDDEMPREETLARFEALGPESTRGPAEVRVLPPAMVNGNLGTGTVVTGGPRPGVTRAVAQLTHA